MPEHIAPVPFGYERNEVGTVTLQLADWELDYLIHCFNCMTYVSGSGRTLTMRVPIGDKLEALRNSMYRISLLVRPWYWRVPKGTIPKPGWKVLIEDRRSPTMR